MLRCYERYLFREVLAAIFLVLFGFLVIFSFLDFIEETRRVGQGTYRFFDVFSFEILRLPGLFYEMFPIATLVGTLYALSTLARHSEITVLRAAGVSTGRFLFSLLKIAALCAFLVFFVGEIIVPISERMAYKIRNEALSRVVGQGGLKSGLWLKDGRDFVNIQEASTTAQFSGLRVYRFRENKTLELEYVMDATSGSFDTDHWVLQDVVLTRLENDNRATTEHYRTQNWASAITPDLLAVLTVTPERMSIINLVYYLHHLSDNRQGTSRYEIALWKKLIYPLSAFVMVVLALPFAYASTRAGGVSLKIFIGVILGISFYALNGIFSNLGVINTWSPFLSAAAPSLLFLMMGMSMLWWAERR